MENKLERLVNGQKSKWAADAQWREENKEWLKCSQAIAIRVNVALRDKKLTQKTLAENMGVSPQQISKIVKGRENLTLQTIAKLEHTLGVTLVSYCANSNTPIEISTFKSHQ